MSGKLIDESETISNEDYRLQAITTLAKEYRRPDGHIHNIGERVMVVSETKFDVKNLHFGLPNVSAMFLNFSNKFYTESENYFGDSSNFISNSPDSLDLWVKDNGLLFDILEKRMGAIVFAYSALEAFANRSIPEEYVFEQLSNNKKCTEKYTKEQIENFLSLDTKLGTILPEIFSVKSPKGINLWSQYCDLRKLRNRIIHLKKDDTQKTTPEVKTLWTDLMDQRLLNHAVITKNIIEYFLKNNRPRWLKKCPF